MARTGRPAVRHVAAVERAFSVLDALADGGELGTNEIARRTGINASTVSRLLATLASARFVEHVHGDRPVSALPEADRARQRGARPPRPARAGAAAPAGSRARDGRDGDAVRPGGARRDHRRLRAQRLRRPERRPARPSERRPRDGGRQGHAGLRRRRAARRAIPCLHVADDHDEARHSSRSWPPFGSAASPAPGRSARRVSLLSPPPCGTAVDGSRGSSASKARPPGSTSER